MLAMPAAESMRAKLFSAAARFERRAVEQELVAGNGKEHAGFIFGAGAESGAEFGPGGLVLFFRARMAEVIHSRELEQDVEAADEAREPPRVRMLGFVTYMWGSKPRLCMQVWGEVGRDNGTGVVFGTNEYPTEARVGERYWNEN